MSEASPDAKRALAAAKNVVDDRNPHADAASIMVTMEHAIATVLLALYPDPAKAAAMLNEGLVQGVEQRLSMRAAEMKEPAHD